VHLLVEVGFLVAVLSLVEGVDCPVAGEDYRAGVDFQEEVEAV